MLVALITDNELKTSVHVIPAMQGLLDAQASSRIIAFTILGALVALEEVK